MITPLYFLSVIRSRILMRIPSSGIVMKGNILSGRFIEGLFYLDLIVASFKQRDGKAENIHI